MGFYVDISDVPIDFLTFMGYSVSAQNDQFILLNHKGEPHIVVRNGTRYLYVEDFNDAAIFERRRKVQAPPEE